MYKSQIFCTVPIVSDQSTSTNNGLYKNSGQVNKPLLVTKLGIPTEAISWQLREIDSIKRFQGSHPEVMHERIHYINWTFDRDPKVKNFTLKKRILYLNEKYTGWRVGEYKNYKIIYLAKVEGLDYY